MDITTAWIGLFFVLLGCGSVRESRITKRPTPNHDNSMRRTTRVSDSQGRRRVRPYPSCKLPPIR